MDPAVVAGTLPSIPHAGFVEALAPLLPTPLPEASWAMLYAHYQTLRRWNPRLALIGPGTVENVLERHYGEALAAVAWLAEAELPVAPETLVDVGSGAGFPGMLLAMACPGLRVFAVESRQRKWSFLEAANRAAMAAAARCGSGARSLWCQPLNARIKRPLPASLPPRIDVVTSRAVRLTPDLLEPLIEHSRQAHFLLWQGSCVDLPAPLVELRRLKLPGSERRHLVQAVAAGTVRCWRNPTTIV